MKKKTARNSQNIMITGLDHEVGINKPIARSRAASRPAKIASEEKRFSANCPEQLPVRPEQGKQRTEERIALIGKNAFCPSPAQIGLHTTLEKTQRAAEPLPAKGAGQACLPQHELGGDSKWSSFCKESSEAGNSTAYPVTEDFSVWSKGTAACHTAVSGPLDSVVLAWDGLGQEI